MIRYLAKRFGMAWHRQCWRHYFAGRMMEITRCTLREGLRRSDDAMIMEPDWATKHPRDVADRRMWIYTPPLGK